MQIFLSVVVNIIVLAVILPLFYIFIMSKARERLEEETVKKVQDELNALVHEFNRAALSNVSLLEDAILRVRREYSDIVSKERTIGNADEKIEHTKKERSVSELDKIESETKKINNMLKFSSKENRKSINIIVDDDNSNNILPVKSENDNTMTKAQIETALKKIKQNISISQEKNIRSDDAIAIDERKSDIKNNLSDNERLDKNKLIIKLYREGLDSKEIAIKTNSSITEVELVLDMEIRDN